MTASDTVGNLQADAAQRLDERYGRRPSRAGRSRWYWIGGGAAAALFVVGAAWTALSSSEFEVDADVVTFVPGDTELSLTVSIVADPSSRPVCQVEALGSDKQVVGFVERAFPMNGRATQRVEIVLQTVEPAVTGLIGPCRLS